MLEVNHSNVPDAISLLLCKLESIEKLLLSVSNNETESDKLLTIKEASTFINLSVPTIYNYVHRNEIPVMKKQRKLYFSKLELINWIKSAKRKTVSELAQETEFYLKKKGGKTL